MSIEYRNAETSNFVYQADTTYQIKRIEAGPFLVEYGNGSLVAGIHQFSENGDIARTFLSVFLSSNGDFHFSLLGVSIEVTLRINGRGFLFFAQRK